MIAVMLRYGGALAVSGATILGGVGPASATTSSTGATQVKAAPADAGIVEIYADAPVPTPVTEPAPGLRDRSLVTRGHLAASQCSGYLWDPASDDLRQANAIMAGSFRFERYGQMRVPANPSWRNQRTLTYEGNGEQHALFWAIPLLRAGMAHNRPEMVARFYRLVDDWLHDNPIRRPRSRQAYGQIETGFRLITLSCAAQFAGRRTGRYVKAMAAQARFAARNWSLVNNASFHAAAGIFAAGCIAGSGRLRQRGLGFMDLAASNLIMRDGSVLEGSLEYGRATYVWTLEEINRIRGCGVGLPGGLSRALRIPEFLARGVRPDGRYEALGDGGTKRAQASDAPGTSLEFAASLGERGTVPRGVLARYEAGFLFGRSAWGGAGTFDDQTFYSVRTGSGPSSVYHAHADAGALTVHARGDQLLFDGGPYYGFGYLRGRWAHNLAAVGGAGYRSPAPRIVVQSSTAEGDLLTLSDAAYARTGLVRTIWYDRQGDFFVVIDDVVQRKRARKIGSVHQIWNFGPDRRVERAGASVHTTGAGANVSLLSIGSQPSYELYRGSRSPWAGWVSNAYADVDRARTVWMNGGRATQVRLATVIVPRGEGIEPSSVSASGYFLGDGAVVTVNNGQDTYQLRVARGAATRL